MKIRARFIGEDERLDYLEIYDLEIERNQVKILKEKKLLVICPYNSIESFFKNWKVLV